MDDSERVMWARASAGCELAEAANVGVSNVILPVEVVRVLLENGCVDCAERYARWGQGRWLVWEKGLVVLTCSECGHKRRAPKRKGIYIPDWCPKCGGDWKMPEVLG